MGKREIEMGITGEQLHGENLLEESLNHGM